MSLKEILTKDVHAADFMLSAFISAANSYKARINSKSFGRNFIILLFSTIHFWYLFRKITWKIM